MSKTNQPPWTILPKRKWEPTGTRVVKDGEIERTIRTWSSKEKTDYLDDELAREAVGL